MTPRLSVTGPADPAVVWDRYADLGQWPRWGPYILGVEADGSRLRPGLRGRVHGPGLGADFVVLSVEAPPRPGEAGAWSWRVTPVAGPLRPPGVVPDLVLHHTVAPRTRAGWQEAGTVAGLRVTGWGPLGWGYLPAGRWALGRLVTD